MSGKWHLGSKPEWGPNHYGFDHSHGSFAGAVGMYDHRYRLDSPFRDTRHRNHEPLEQEGHVTDLTCAEAVAFIEKHEGGQRPWFFYVAFPAVHTPLVERDPRWLKANEHIEDPHRRLYAAALTHMDHGVGEMVEALERTGQRDRTLIVYTSGNGAQANHGGTRYPPPDPKLRNFSSNAPLRGKKSEVYEGGYRVPAFVNWPGQLKPRKCTQPIHAVDWMPTLGTLVIGNGSGSVPEGIDGEYIVPHLSGVMLDTERTFYIVWGNRRGEALRDGDWKILRHGEKAPWELYNLADDPCEKRNLAEEQPKLRDELVALYEKHRARDAVPQRPWRPQPGEGEKAKK